MISSANANHVKVVRAILVSERGKPLARTVCNKREIGKEKEYGDIYVDGSGNRYLHVQGKAKVVRFDGVAEELPYKVV